MREKFTLKKLILTIVVLYAIVSVISQQIKITKINQEITAQEKQLEELKDKNAKLQEEVEFSKTDAYLERMTRERLGYIKPGEVPVLNDDSLKSP